MISLIDLFKVLSDQNRLRILHILKHYELCVCELEVVLGLSQSNVSRHLGKLRQVDLLEADKEAQWMHYRFNERFQAKEPELIAFLERRFEEDPVFQEDIERCKQYVKSSYTCQTITSDRQLVIHYLEQDDPERR